MKSLDNNEQTIYNALSQINVDTGRLAKQVRERLHEEVPHVQSARHRRWTVSAAAAVAMSLLLVFTAAAATLGGFDWFMKKFNPSFGDIVEPVGVYCEDQGIRMEVIGAQKYDNMAVVYLSLQDVSGQNRLTERTDFQDGFSVKMNTHAKNTEGQPAEVSSSYSWSKNMLYFDELSNTVYYEFNITADSLSDPLELGSFLIYFDTKKYADQPVSISLSNIEKTKTLYIDGEQIWGGSNLDGDIYEATILSPGKYAPMPHGENDQWISNVGIIDGKLHIQTGKLWNKEFGSSDASLALLSPDGESISPDYELMLLGDDNGRMLSSDVNAYAEASYKYEEFVFSVNTLGLDSYTLYYSGSVYSGIEGRWKVSANLSNTDRQIRRWTNDIPVEGHLFEHITLSPLGMQVIGSYTGDTCMASDMSVEIETAGGVYQLKGGGGALNDAEKTFNLHWNTEAPLNADAATNIIINGIRIPVK